ncbi:MAG TPA: TonB-dependent receptor [Bacteroidia bacterium]|jgi:iron complex outermembrane receptor protein|nr:TonB-dependent receptor [Bacteroidia bacterium]
MKKKLALVIFNFLIICCALAQQNISGVINDSKGNPLPGVNVVEKGTYNGTTTNANGQFTLIVKEQATLVFSFVGFATQELKITDQTDVTISLIEGTDLQSITVVGSRTPPRSSTTSALPVDVIAAGNIAATGQPTFDKALQYLVPSFNTVQTPVNDATSLLDPYEIRNMGPSRTLILINGKRKNLSSLLYVQTSPGRGETGADLAAIPMDAIKRVEILRDGASAQYGSDAIAGVVNIVLKDHVDYGTLNLKTGITSKGDGQMFGVSFNNGTALSSKSFINYTIDLSKTALANRPGKVSAEGEFNTFYDPSASKPITIEEVQAFLKEKPDAGNINGSPETSAIKFLVNGGTDITENIQFYYNGAYVNKRVNSFANYRTPYWRQTDYGLLTPPGEKYMGFGPTFQGILSDYNATLGFKSTKNGWNTDVSFTTGGNQQTYLVSNSLNYGIEQSRADAIAFNTAHQSEIDSGLISPKPVLAKTPTTFHPGGAKFRQDVGNVDVSRILNEKVSIALGAEFRSETFEVVAGDEASYILGGAESFAGNDKVNSFSSNRHNIGGYLDVALDATPNLLLNGTIRAENYSDFGNTVIGKFSTRYKFLQDKISLRGSASTGFRAPSLHQIYTQKSQYSFGNGTIEVQGLLNNVSAEAKALGIPKLKPEESVNFTLGMGYRVSNNLSFTLDYYNITVKNRIILSNTIRPTGNNNTELDNILNASGIKSLSFFVNAVDTRTSGLDLVVSYRNLALGTGKLGFNFSGNYTLENKRIGAVKNPSVIEEVGQTVLNQTQEALMFTSRPQFKAILGIDYDIQRFSFNLSNTVFGPTKFRNADLNENLGIEFLTKVVTDLSVFYRITNRTTVGFVVNNILNVLPEWKFVAFTPAGEAILNDPAKVKEQSDFVTFNQRYSMTTYDGSHFSQLGTIFNLSVNIKF